MSEFKPCPFCGREPVVSKDSPFFSVTCSCGNTAKTSLKKAIESWNRRTPEPGTSVIRWTRYDGTPETLPEERKFFLLNPIRMRSEVIPMPAILTRGCFSINLTSPMDREMQFCEKRPEIGDAWAYLPTPPEGQQ